MLTVPKKKWSEMRSADIHDENVIAACNIAVDEALTILGMIRMDGPFDEIVTHVGRLQTATGAISSSCSVAYLQQLVATAGDPQR
jgi:hypothetical protein